MAEPMLALLALVLVSPATSSPWPNRHSEPVVLTGEEVGMGEVEVDSLVAFRREEGVWVQVPVQVDERHVVDWEQVKQVDCRIHRRELTSLVYSDMDTYTGSDPDSSFDGDDELVVMARDAGEERYSGSSPPGGVLPDTLREVALRDPLHSTLPVGYLYLFSALAGSSCPPSGCLQSSAGEVRVDYNFTLTRRDEAGSNAYKDVYTLDNRHNDGGGNPEDSTVETLYYRRHWRENWLSDGLSFGVGEDILLLQDFQFLPSNCGRHVGTFRKSRNAFIANKSGPLRAIRSWIGANSGTLTQRDSLMYEGREDLVTHLRVHSIPGVMDFTLFQPETPLTWYNGRNLAGVPVDGVPDTIDPTYSPWQLVTSEWGSYLRSYALEQDFFPGGDPAAFVETFHVDNREPESFTDAGVAIHPGNFHMCCSNYMNTSVAWGVSGFQLQAWIPGVPNTDPNRVKPWPEPLPEGTCKNGEDATVNLLRLAMRQLYLPAGLSPAEAQALHAAVDNPLVVAVSNGLRG